MIVRTLAVVFSVVIPTRDRSGSLPQVLGAVRNQTLPAHEVIVVDDGSIDDTPSVLEELGRGIIVVRTPGVGVFIGPQRGLGHGHRSLLVFLDDDDEPDSGWLAGLNDLAGENIGLLGCAVTIRTVAGESIVRPTPDSPLHPAVFLPGAFAVLRSALVSAGGYLDGLTYAENTELAMRLVPHLRASRLETRTTSASLHTMNRGPVRRSVAGRSQALSMLIEHHEDELARQQNDSQGFFRSPASIPWRDGDRSRSRRLLRQAVRCRPWSWHAWGHVVAAHVPPIGERAWVRPSARLSEPIAG